MASPPFNPDETKPQGSDIISNYPAVERTFRDIIESWLLVEHNRDGQHDQVTLEDQAGSTPSGVVNHVTIWQEGGVIKVRDGTGTVEEILKALVDDSSPQLGGNLDLNGSGLTFPGATVTDVTGADTQAVSGTAGTNGNLAEWNVDGDLVDGPDVLDEDNMASDSATAVATQQSIKAYVDDNASALTLESAVNLSGGSTAELATGLPSGVSQIDVVINEASQDGTQEFRLQIGDSGGYETSGYSSKASEGESNTESTASFLLIDDTSADASATFSGILTLRRLTGTNTWLMTGSLLTSDAGKPIIVSTGIKTLSGELDRVRLTAEFNSFDNGTASIQYQ